MLKIKETDEGFKWFDFLITMYAAYKNNFMFQDLKDIPEVELNAEIESLYNLIREHIEVGEL